MDIENYVSELCEAIRNGASESDVICMLNGCWIPRCDGNHGGPPCRDRECWNDSGSGEAVEVWLGNGDKLVADIYTDDGSWAGVGIFQPPDGKTHGIGEPDGQIDGQPLDKSNALVLIKSTKPESLQVVVDELRESMDRMGYPHPSASVPEVLPALDPNIPREEQGLYGKFLVRRVDGSDDPGGKHHGCRYFVLDVDHDQFAPAALGVYAEQCKGKYPELAKDLHEKMGAAAPQPAASVPDPDIQIIEERDYWEDKATELADDVGEYLGVEVGEHSSANCPVQNAIDALATSPKPASSASVPEGCTLVRTLVLKWLLGETESFEPLEGEHGRYWWRKRLREAMLTAAPQPAHCQTCGGHGRIGGPSYAHPDEGGELCPDCNTPQPSEAPDLFYEAIGWCHAQCCVWLDEGKDPRTEDCSQLVIKAERDFKIYPDQSLQR